VNIEQLIVDYGSWFYLVTFLWTFLEGETFVIFAGVAAQKGLLEWWLVFVLAWTGSFCGDQCYFWIGRIYGPRLLARWPRLQRGVSRAYDRLGRHDTAFILTYRFIYGIRNIASFAIGMAGVPPRRFALLNFAAAGLWALSFAGGGYLFGHAIEAIVGDVVEGVGLTLLFLLALLVAFALGRSWLARRREAVTALVAPPTKPPA